MLASPSLTCQVVATLFQRTTSGEKRLLTIREQMPIIITTSSGNLRTYKSPVSLSRRFTSYVSLKKLLYYSF
jgi:ABC-type uncharacterized transport system ATPase component